MTAESFTWWRVLELLTAQYQGDDVGVVAASFDWPEHVDQQLLDMAHMAGVLYSLLWSTALHAHSRECGRTDCDHALSPRLFGRSITAAVTQGMAMVRDLDERNS